MHSRTLAIALAALAATFVRPAAAQPTFLDYVELTPCRVIDTRDGSGASASDDAAGPRTNPGPFDVQVKGSCGVPSDAAAVTLNITVVEPTLGGDLRIANQDANPFPVVSTVNYEAGVDALANGAVVPLKSGAGDDARMVFGMVGSGQLHVVVDVSGYFVPDPVQSIAGDDGITVTNVDGNVTVALSAGLPSGPTGATGPAGADGAPGATGPMGATGPAGDPAPVDPAFAASQILHVNKAGADIAENDGSDEEPFLTIAYALTRITDQSPAKRYAIHVGPGTYDETIHLEANVQLIGAGAPFTRINGTLDIADPTWDLVQDAFGQFTDHRSGFSNLTLGASSTFDFVANQSEGGKLVFVDVIFATTPVFTGLSTSVNQIDARNCRFANGYTQTGTNMLMVASYVSAGTITINSKSGVDTQVKLVGGGTAGDVIVNVGDFHVPIDPFWLMGFSIKGKLTVNGSDSTNMPVFASADSLPIAENVILSGTGTKLVRTNDAFGLAYTPAVSADWSGPDPATVQEALDRLAALVGPVP